MFSTFPNSPGYEYFATFRVNLHNNNNPQQQQQRPQLETLSSLRIKATRKGKTPIAALALACSAIDSSEDSLGDFVTLPGQSHFRFQEETFFSCSTAARRGCLKKSHSRLFVVCESQLLLHRFSISDFDNTDHFSGDCSVPRAPAQDSSRFLLLPLSL